MSRRTAAGPPTPTRAPGRIAVSAFETTEAGVALQSDWSRSDLHGQLKGGYTDYFDDSNANSPPYGSGTLDGRYDATPRSVVRRRRPFQRQRADADLARPRLGNAAATAHPLVSTYGATLGGAQKFGDLTLALHGTLDRTIIRDAPAGLDDLASDDFNDWGLRGRVSYRLSEAISPFVELGVDARRYDSSIDFNGYDRNSDGWQAVAGATLAFTPPADRRSELRLRRARLSVTRACENFGGPLIDASLIWSATPLTTVTAKAQTDARRLRRRRRLGRIDARLFARRRPRADARLHARRHGELVGRRLRRRRAARFDHDLRTARRISRVARAGAEGERQRARLYDSNVAEFELCRQRLHARPGCNVAGARERRLAPSVTVRASSVPRATAGRRSSRSARRRCWR